MIDLTVIAFIAVTTFDPEPTVRAWVMADGADRAEGPPPVIPMPLTGPGHPPDDVPMKRNLPAHELARDERFARVPIEDRFRDPRAAGAPAAPRFTPDEMTG